MKKSLNAFAVSLEVKEFIKQLQEGEGFSEFDIQWKEFENKDEISDLESFDFGVAGGPACLQLGHLVKKRSLGSHFLNYIDFIKVDGKDLWGQCLFYKALERILRTYIKTQDLKGSVIFLGDSPFIYPALGVLSQFGYNDFVFLNLNEGSEEGLTYQSAVSGLFDVKTTSVNSEAFIQSQKEYALCFVLENNYSTQTLEDMSYFHFLSGMSMVFDLAGDSNFSFEEVKALGVSIVKYSDFSKIYNQVLVSEIKNCL